MIIAENESDSVIGIGDLIARVPMITQLSQAFHTSSIEVFLKPAHLASGVMPTFHNVMYKKVLGNTEFKTNKAPSDMFSATDLEHKEWGLVVDSSGGNGYRVMKSILDNDTAHRVKHFIPCNMITAVWNRPLRGSPLVATIEDRFKAHELFFHCLNFYLTGDTQYQTPSTPHVFQSLPAFPTPPTKTILIIDKSPFLNKLWIHEGKNAFDSVTSLLQRAGWQVFVHRYLGPGESLEHFPQYVASKPSLLNASLDAFPQFFMEHKPAVILGIDTGVMHFAAAMKPDQRLIEVFVTDEQNPYIWAAPGATVFTAFPTSQPFHQVSPETLVADILSEFNECIGSVGA